MTGARRSQSLSEATEPWKKQNSKTANGRRVPLTDLLGQTGKCLVANNFFYFLKSSINNGLILFLVLPIAEGPKAAVYEAIPIWWSFFVTENSAIER